MKRNRDEEKSGQGASLLFADQEVTMANLTTELIHEETFQKKRRFGVGTLIAFVLLLGLLGLLGWGLIKVNSGQLDSGIAPDFTITASMTRFLP
jgi:hypothetical protein